MWIGIILSILFGAMIAIGCIWAIIAYYCPEDKIYRESEYRYYIKHEQPYDDWGDSFCRDRFRYTTQITEEDKKDYIKYKKREKKKANTKKALLICVPIIIFLFAVFGFGCLGAFLENESLSREVEKYKAAKYTIEASLQNDNLTGFEKIELVKQASAQNSWLAEKQYEVKQWYRFYLNKDTVLELEMIDL